MSETILETARLALRRIVASDLDFIADMLMDRETSRFYGQDYTRADAENWMQRIFDRYERDGYAFWLAEDRATRHPIGQMGLLNQEVDSESLLEIGYMIHRSH